jgi:hypothetical protein
MSAFFLCALLLLLLLLLLHLCACSTPFSMR